MKKNAFTKIKALGTALVAAAAPSAGGAVTATFATAGYDEILVAVGFGAEAGGDTLSGTNKYTVKAEHSTAAAGSYSVYTTADCDSATDIAATTGVFATIDAAADAGKTYHFSGYHVDDFTKISVTPAGTLATGCIVWIEAYGIRSRDLPVTNAT